jgi:hypothetical protein
VKGSSKSSYAASFSYIDIDEENKIRIANYLKDFKAISVREYHGLDILKSMRLNGTWVLDPVFLLSEEEWKIQMTDFIKKEPYMLIYDFEGNKDLKNFAKEYAKKNGLKLYAIMDTYPLLYADKNFNNAGPKEFITLIFNCDAFVSNSFHGTAFSILFEKPVFVFNRHRHKVNSRMESLLTLFNMKGCLIQSHEEAKNALNINFDYIKTKEILKNELLKSTTFLKELL